MAPPTVPGPRHQPDAVETSSDSRRRGLAWAGSSHLAVTFMLLFAGVLLLELVWVASVGPFRAIDEFDHALRADAVAGGQWLPPDDDLVTVQTELSAATTPVCLSRVRAPDLCLATETGDDRSEIYSSAAAYNPLFYWVVGTASAPFSEANGYRQLYGMRLACSLLNALVIAAALLITLTAFRTRWPFIMALTTLTPMVTYGAMIVAPNGLETSAALALWAALLGLRLGRPSPRSTGWLWLVVALSGATLGLLRALGPFWFICILVAVLLVGTRDLGWVRKRPAACALGVALTGCLAGGLWTLFAGTNRVGSTTSESSRSAAAESLSATQSAGGPHLSELPLQMLLWPFQTVAAIPYRDESVPLVVYAVTFALWGVALMFALRSAPVTLVRSGAFVVAVSVAVPLAFTLATYQSGWLWQGRYGWPLAVGLLLVAGVALEAKRVDVPVKVQSGVLVMVASAMAFVTLLASFDVVHRESVTSPLAGNPSVWSVPNAVVATLAVAGFGLLLAAGIGSGRRPTPGAAPHNGRSDIAT